MALRNTCIGCDGALTRYAHWGICTDMTCAYGKMNQTLIPVKPRPALVDKGRPTRGGKLWDGD